jgi:hypothetical protein
MGAAAESAGLPHKLALVHHGSHVEIVLTWFGWKVLLMTPFALLWDGFLVKWYLSIGPSANPIMWVFPLPHVIVGVVYTYYVLAGWFNRTHIIVGPGSLIVRHAPIPWLGNKILQASRVRQVYVKERTTRSRRGAGSVSYEVRAVTQDWEETKLVGGIESPDQALYIEEEIEKHLALEDAPLSDLGW